MVNGKKTTSLLIGIDVGSSACRSVSRIILLKGNLIERKKERNKTKEKQTYRQKDGHKARKKRKKRKKKKERKKENERKSDI